MGVGVVVGVAVNDSVLVGVADKVAEGVLEGVAVGVSVGLANRPQKSFRLPIIATEATPVNRQSPTSPNISKDGIENRLFFAGGGRGAIWPLVRGAGVTWLLVRGADMTWLFASITEDMGIKSSGMGVPLATNEAAENRSFAVAKRSPRSLAIARVITCSKSLGRFGFTSKT